MRRALIIIAVIVVLLGVLALVGGRIAEGVATSQAERRLVEEGASGDVEVDVKGPPFLLQVARREFDQVDVRAQSFRLDDVTVTDLDATLHDVQVESRRSAVAGTLDARATVPFSAVEQRLGLAQGSLSADGDQVRFIRSVDVLGQEIQAEATATVEADGTSVVVRPQSVEVPGLGSLDEVLSNTLVQRLTFSYAVPGLPTGTKIEHVDVESGGFRVRLTGEDVPLEVDSS